eukprot:15364890-Ditylum_brightwellii.AAC.1
MLSAAGGSGVSQALIMLYNINTISPHGLTLIKKTPELCLPFTISGICCPLEFDILEDANEVLEEEGRWWCNLTMLSLPLCLIPQSNSGRGVQNDRRPSLWRRATFLWGLAREISLGMLPGASGVEGHCHLFKACCFY